MKQLVVSVMLLVGFGPAGLAQDGDWWNGETFQGTLVLVDESGQEHSNVSGFIVLGEVVRTDQGRLTDGNRILEKVPVTNGAWMSGVSIRGDVRIAEAELEGRPVVIKSGFRYPPLTKKIELKATFVKKTILRVVDGETKAIIDEVFMIPFRKSPAEEMSKGDYHPGIDVTSLPETVTSPVEFSLDGPRKSQELWIGAPGYSWALTRIDHNDSDVTVELINAGSIKVSGLAPLNADIRCLIKFSSGRETLFVHVPHVDSVTFDGIRCGKCKVELLFGIPFFSPEIRQDSTFEITPNSTHEFIVDPENASLPEGQAQLHGWIAIPGNWGNRTLSLEALSLDSMQQLELDFEEEWIEVEDNVVMKVQRENLRDLNLTEDNRELPWDFGVVPRGRYLLRIEEIGWRHVVHLTEEEELFLDVPEPADVHLRLRDAVNGDSIREHFDWVGELCGLPLDMQDLEPAEYNEDSGTYFLRVPKGTLNIDVYYGKYIGKEESTEVAAGLNHWDVRLDRYYGVDVRLEGVRPRPKFTVKAEPLDSGVKVVFPNPAISHMFRLSQSGRVRVSIVLGEEYEPCPAQDVKVGGEDREDWRKSVIFNPVSRK